MGKAEVGELFQNVRIMSCGCENLKKRLNYGVMCSLAKKAATLDGVNYVIYEKDGLYNFCVEGEKFEGKFVELVVPELG